MIDEIQLLKSLCTKHGIPGYEGEICSVLKPHFEALMDEVTQDGLGSLIGYQKGVHASKTLMLASHMDEVGAMVKQIDDHGFIFLQAVGGLSPFALLNQMMILTLRDGRQLHGVIGTTFEHKKIKDIDFDDIYLDLGMNAEEVKQCGVRPGDRVTFSSDFYCLNETKVVSKALDDRVGLWILLMVAKRLKEKEKNIDVAYCATVQEEVGCRGAQTASYKVKPDYAISVDVTFSNDTPGNSERNDPLGSGVCLSIIDTGTIYHAGLLQHMEKVLDERHLPYTYEVTHGGTDSSKIQLQGEGIACLNLSIPMRYMHYAKGMVDMKDALVIVDALEAFILSFPDGGLDL